MSGIRNIRPVTTYDASIPYTNNVQVNGADVIQVNGADTVSPVNVCLLYTSPSPRDRQKSRMPSSA